MLNKSKEDRTADVLAAPFLIAVGASRLVKQSMGIVAEGARLEPKPSTPPPNVSSPLPGSPSGPVVADKVFRQQFGSVNVSFYQYYNLGIIRAVARKDGVVKLQVFTPEIAAQRGVVFDMRRAIDWIREVGFRNVRPVDPSRLTVPRVPPQAAIEPPQQEAEPVAQQRASAPAAAPSPATPKAAPVQATPASPSPGPGAKPPVDGEIVEIGLKECLPSDGRPGFTSYAITLSTQRNNEKVFYGEHLQELADQLDLKAGMRVRIQLLGKKPFSVEVRGRWENRTRNEYSIVVL